MSDPERIDPHRAALIAYDVCRRALTPADPARQAAMRPVLDAAADDRGSARGDCADYLHHARKSRRWRRCRHAADRSFGGNPHPAADQWHRGHTGGRLPRRDRAASGARTYVFLKRSAKRVSRCTGVAELLHMLRRDVIIIGAGRHHRGSRDQCA